MRNKFFACLAAWTLAVALAPVSRGEAPSPDPARTLRLKDGRPYCEALACDRLFPEATRFAPVEGLDLPVLAAHRNEELLGYLFLSVDLAPIPAYSGKPLVTLIAMDPGGVILGAKVIQHKEPILLVGIPERVLDDYLAQYLGRSILEPGLLELSAETESERETSPPEEAEHDDGEEPEHQEGVPERTPRGAKERMLALSAGTPLPHVYMITGATVTALVLDETLLTSSRAVARGLGLLKEESRREITWRSEFAPKSWDELFAEGSIGRLTVRPVEMEEAPSEQPWIDLYFADVTQPVVGRNLLGESTHAWLTEHLKPGEKALFVAGRGANSFKGSGFVRGGIYDRFHLRQGMNQFVFKDLDYEHLYEVAATGAPRFRESGLFFIRDTRFDSTLPWKFVFLASRLTGETATSKLFKTFTADYALPAKYYSVREEPTRARRTIVATVWRDQWPEALVLALFLSMVMGVFFARRWLRVSARRLELVHTAVLVLSVVLVGIVMKTPPSVTQLFPLVQGIQEGFRPGLFLSDPLLFVFWIFIAASLLLWGRGWFCGWVCPYGALLELVHSVSKRLLPKGWVRQLPLRAHHVLRRLRYVILAALVVLSLFSLEWAERLAEVEPFKTTWIVGVFNRDWYFALYWWALLGVSLFVFRFFCRYLCPLGAALSIGTAIRRIGIRRKEFCTRCKICARQCDSLAINDSGVINKFECLYCLECEQKYHDDRICPPLVIARRKAERQAAPAAQPEPLSERGASAAGAAS
jgi:NosR/NirI family nitrous oxide reductase transcriptional regulator